MGRPVVDLVGKRFGKLTVIERAENKIQKNGREVVQWRCRCDCGNEKLVVGGDLKSKSVQSCGCLARADNLIGAKINHLTVLSQYLNEKNVIRYKCLCDCGNEYDVSRHALIKGETKQCPKCRPKIKPGRRKDITGNRYGMLVAVRRDKEEHYTAGGNKVTHWICKCDCGREISISLNALRQGNRVSCGCYVAKKYNMSYEEFQKKIVIPSKSRDGKLRDLTGQRFGKLTVIERSDNSRINRVMWRCKCDCGSETIVSAANLQSGHTKSCGCIDSVGEAMISMYLTNRNIKFKKEQTFSDCRDNHKLPFDFGIYDNNDNLLGLIEFDGKQHFVPVRFNGMTPERAQKMFDLGVEHDKVKDKYCKTNDIPLLRIHYTQVDNIDNILEEYIKGLMKVG